MRGSKVVSSLLLLALSSTTTLAAESKKDLRPCTVYNPTNGNFYDLNGIMVHPLKDHKKVHKDDRTESWHARGYDYNTNFTLNICGPVVEPLKDVVGVKDDLAKNISAYYTVGKKIYSIGQASTEPIFRGRNLVLNYTDGSPCGDDDSSSSRYSRRKLNDHDDDKDDDDDDDNNDNRSDKKPSKHKSPSSPSSPNPRRKSTIISFHCDQDSLSALHLSFIAASPDECTYFFEARSPSACGGAIASQQALGAGGVFTVIALVAVAVYLLGGIAYQRTVMHQRGWRQLPNYGLWAGIFGFVSDMTVILCGSCLRFLPKRRGYDRLSGGIGGIGSGGGRNGGLRGGSMGRGSRTQEENGLIDSLDEEWND